MDASSNSIESQEGRQFTNIDKSLPSLRRMAHYA
jgi:hypothetical protein